METPSLESLNKKEVGYLNEKDIEKIKNFLNTEHHIAFRNRQNRIETQGYSPIGPIVVELVTEDLVNNKGEQRVYLNLNLSYYIMTSRRQAEERNVNRDKSKGPIYNKLPLEDATEEDHRRAQGGFYGYNTPDIIHTDISKFSDEMLEKTGIRFWYPSHYKESILSDNFRKGYFVRLEPNIKRKNID